MIRNWENEKYAHTMTMASRNLPRSCRWRWVSTSDMGRWRYSRTIRAMRNAIAVIAWLTMKSMPKMVENHLGSTDRIQSTAMKVTLKPQKRRPDRKSTRLNSSHLGI